MQNVKLKQGNSEIIALNKSVFEEKTLCRPPYYTDENTQYPFAVCPQCDNPVKIIGFYKDIKPKPYAEHYEEDVVGLVEYISEDKEFCAYFDKRRSISKTERRNTNKVFVGNIKTILREQYDRVIFILEKKLGFYISDDLADKMMKSFVQSRAWEYSWTTINNLPWVFGYIQSSKTLVGRMIKKSSQLYTAVSENGVNLCFEKTSKTGYEQLVKQGNNFVSVNYVIIHHERKVENGNLFETMTFIVTQKIGGNEKTLYRDIIEIDEKYFLNLINAEHNEDKRRRKDVLLGIAKKYL